MRGNAAFARGDLAAAERHYGHALDADPSDEASRNNRAACCLQAKPPRPRDAMKWLRPLLHASPPNAKALYRAGRCCIMLGELERAQAVPSAIAIACSY